MVILFVLVAISLAFSLFALLILAENHIGIINEPILPTSTPKSTPTSEPTPTNKPTPTNISVSYSEVSRVVFDGNNRVTLMVNVTYTGGISIGISSSQFYLQLYAPRSFTFLPQGTVNPLNSGDFSVGSNQTSQEFQLQFI